MTFNAWVAVLIVVSIPSLTGCSHEPAPPAVPTIPASQLPTQFVKTPATLGPGVNLGGYVVSPPAGTEMIPTKSQSGASAKYDWKSARRADRSRMTFEVSFVRLDSLSPMFRQDLSPTGQVKFYVADLGSLYADLTVSKATYRPIGKINFIRFYWKGYSPRSRQEEHGFVYSAIHVGQSIEIQGVDHEPDNQTTLPLCEMAAFSFRPFVP